jgi:hypothetical protein
MSLLQFLIIRAKLAISNKGRGRVKHRTWFLIIFFCCDRFELKIKIGSLVQVLGPTTQVQMRQG